jgi:hypothetical protein
LLLLLITSRAGFDTLHGARHPLRLLLLLVLVLLLLWR